MKRRRAKKAAIHPVVAEASRLFDANRPAIMAGMAEAALFGTTTIRLSCRWLCEILATDVTTPVYAVTWWEARVVFAKFLSGIGHAIEAHDPRILCVRADRLPRSK